MSTKRSVNAGNGDEDQDSKTVGKDSHSVKKVKTELNTVFELGMVVISYYVRFTVAAVGGRKKVTIGEFQGKKLVNIREFYEDKATGEEKPGSKGIALNIDQWNNLVKMVCIALPHNSLTTLL